MCRRWLSLWAGWLLLVAAIAPAWANEPVRLGVLAHRPPAVEAALWQPVAEALQQSLPHRDVQLQLLNFEQLDAAIQARQVDFVITNPGHYVLLTRREGLSTPLATLVRHGHGKTLAGLGGVAFVPYDSPIQRWEDLQGQRVAIVGFDSLGGYQLQAYAMRQRGIDIQHNIHWQTVGLPHDNVVSTVLAGRADAGFLRNGVLEDLIAKGQLRHQQVRVLHPQPLPEFPAQLSTPLYPEWPAAALPGIDRTLQREFAVALLTLDARRSGQPKGEQLTFELPQSYSSIEDVLRTLRLPPFGVPSLSVRETLELNRPLVAGTGTVLLLLLIGSTVLWLQRRRLRRVLGEQAAMLDELAIAAETFESSMGVLITDGNQRIQRVNHAFCEITGYTVGEVLGQTPTLFHSGRHDEQFYHLMREHLDTHGKWQGEIWNRRKNGEIFPEWLSISMIRDTDGSVRHYVAIFSDLTWRKSAEQQIEQLAFYDPLTGLANRRLLLDRVGAGLANAARHRHWGALLFLDLDHFKEINDTLGHEAGDHVLQSTADRIRHALREADTAGRLGGDEFLVLLEATHTDRDSAAMAAKTVAEKLLHALTQPILVHQQQLSVSASIGISLFCDGHTTAEGLLKEADLAMYQVKQNGRNNVCFFDPAMEATVRQRFVLQQQLAAAIDRDELHLYCQPQIDMHGTIIGGEILLRWKPQEGGMISPGVFIPLAEKSGLILPIGAWVLQQTCATLQRWQADPALSPLRLAVNVSARQFKEPSFAEQLQRMAQEAGIAHEQLELEITESVFLGDLHEARQVLETLDRAGFQLALDDFGTGYSSLSYLAELPFDLIKIDQSFVARLGQALRQDDAIVSTIIALARKLDMRVLAEGVETPSQHHHLRAHGCHLFQGYLFGKPVPLPEFEALVRQSTENEAQR